MVCPRCTGEIEGTRCKGCGSDFAGPLGILDLSPEDPRDPLTQELLERAERMSFDELFAWYLPNLRAGRSEESANVNVRYASEAERRSERMAAMFSGATVASSGKALQGEAVLDLGCGMGAMLVPLAKRYERVVGIDLSLRVLAFAAARIRARGLRNVRLVKGVRGAIPLSPSTFDAVVALNVLEHLVDDIDETLREIRRILRPGGVFCGDSRNRYDLFFHEPHVHLRFVGYLPRPLQAPYVKWRTGRGYSGTQLLSPLEAKRKAERHIGPVAIRLSQPSAFGKVTSADDLVSAIDRVPVLRSVAQAVYPSLVLVARRP